MTFYFGFSNPDSIGTIGRKRSIAFFGRTLSTDRPKAFGFWDSDRVRGNLVGLRCTNYNWIGIFRSIHYDPRKNPWESKRIVESFWILGISPAQGDSGNLIRKPVTCWNALFDPRGVNHFDCAAGLRLRASSRASYPRPSRASSFIQWYAIETPILGFIFFLGQRTSTCIF